MSVLVRGKWYLTFKRTKELDPCRSGWLMWYVCEEYGKKLNVVIGVRDD